MVSQRFRTDVRFSGRLELELPDPWERTDIHAHLTPPRGIRVRTVRVDGPVGDCADEGGDRRTGSPGAPVGACPPGPRRPTSVH